MIYALTVLFIAICIVVLICPIIRSGQISEIERRRELSIRLRELRKQAIDGGMTLLSEDEVVALKHERREGRE